MQILTALKDLIDSRRDQSKIYKLDEIVFCSIIAVICDANSYRDIESFIRLNFKLFKKQNLLSCKHSPAYTTIRNIILIIDKNHLQSILSEHFLKLIDFRKENHFSFDGKSIRGSYDTIKNTSAAHILEIFETKLGITVGYENVRDMKTNEIPIAQQLLSTLPIEGTMFTADALHCQKETVDICLKNGNDLLVQVKNNQKDILKTCQTRVKIAHNYEVNYSTDKSHGRIEERTTTVYQGIPSYIKNWSKKFKTVIKVERSRGIIVSGVKSFEESYYLCTKELTASEASKLVRDHWGIENRQNHVLDETFGEDKSRIRVKPEIFSMFRIIALNILRLNGIKNIRRKRKELGYAPEAVFKLKFL